MKNYYIYIITNKILNKKYIGSRICHNKTPEEDPYMGSSEYLNMDYNIYGIENFSKTIIKDNYSNIKDMLDDETKFILEFNTLEPNGYNRYLPNKYIGFHTGGYKLKENHKEKISQALKGIKSGFKGKFHTEKSKKKIKEKLEGIIPINKGLKMDEDFCNKTKIGIKEKRNPIPWNKGLKTGNRDLKINEKISKTLKKRFNKIEI
jgi:group I intron endonuclease